MNPVTIKVEKLSKQYRLGQIGGGTLSGDLNRWWAQIRRKPDPTLKIGQEDQGNSSGEYIWALRDITFEVRQGEVLGIIGRNGAGKSTLLKILSRITAPTSGQVKLNGRVGSLLEVGTGFHPELTGRENIYLNGAILGMANAEIDRKFDEIVDFSGIDKFIDTPVKRYSSGMYVRLAFAVAAHLELEILVVDEVLAVGDIAFQQKCLNKMDDVSGEGRTVLFVSHNIGAISRLTDKSILLDNGEMILIGETAEVLERYTSTGLMYQTEYVQPTAPDKTMHLRKALLMDMDNNCKNEIPYHESFKFVLEYEVNHSVTSSQVGIGLFTAAGVPVFVSADFDDDPELLGTRLPGHYKTEVIIPGKWLNTGKYTVTVYLSKISTRESFEKIEALAFNVFESYTPGSYQGINYRKGVLQPILTWNTIHVDK